MGRTFTTAHIHNNDGSTKASFKKAFSDVIRSKGYTLTDVDNASLSYTLVFSKDRKWVTVLSEDMTDVRKDTAELAKSLKAHAVIVDLVDSDFAELSLFDDTGSHIDTLTLGESYLGDDAPLGEPQAWQLLLTDGNTWKRVSEIQKGRYTFAEEALHDFAPLIGMNSENIQLDSECDTDDMNAVVLHFKHAKEKKLTLNTAFAKVFGEYLEPLGFVDVKESMCYMRVKNKEIVHVIRLKSEKNFMVTPHTDPSFNKHFDVYCAAFSVYDRDVTRYFGKNNKNLFNLYSDAENTFIKKNGTFFDSEKYAFLYNDDDSQTLIAAMDLALDYVLNNMLPLLDKVTDLEGFIDFANDYLCFVDTFPLYVISGNYHEIIQKEMKKDFERAENDPLLSENQELFNEISEEARDLEKRIDDIVNDEMQYKEFLEQLNIDKKNNIEVLRSYGLDV